MNDLAALLKAVCENPEQDVPRLILADYWEEHGEPERAEFVRVQVELARLPNYHLSCTGDKCLTCYPLRRRERELFHDAYPELPAIEPGWKVFPASWAQPHHYLPGGPLVIMSRGFLSSIICSWPDFLRVADALIWVAGQTVECPKCVRGMCNDMDIGDITFNEWPCENCGGMSKDEQGLPANVPGTGRIPRPFPPTAQPITRVTLTGNDPRDYGWNGRFDRVTCETCDGRGVWQPSQNVPYDLPCDQCHGTPLNEWHCDKWPGLVFVMPEAEQPRRRMTDEERYHYGDVPLGTRQR
jgi:uncharacterized protein (TIGR02996 family)